MYQLTRGLERRGHVGEVVADGLVLPNRLAEALPFLGVAQRILQRCPADAERPAGDLDATDLQSAHHLREPATLVTAQQRGRRRAKVVEGQFAAFHALAATL